MIADCNWIFIGQCNYRREGMDDQQILSIAAQYGYGWVVNGEMVPFKPDEDDGEHFLEMALALLAKKQEEVVALHAKLAGVTLRADQGWQRYEAANKARIKAESELVEARAESAFQKNHMCEHDGCAVAHHDDVIGYKPQAKQWVVEWHRMKNELEALKERSK
tara:strand:- start:34975 stop:35463 length:489 start_codon:yes stop_codon:yes gene_type:complete